MSEPDLAEPEADLLEFLGGVDEVNDGSQDGDFADFLATTDLERILAPGKKPVPPLRQDPPHE